MSMRMVIKSRTLGEKFKFFAPDGGGYVRLEHGTKQGALGDQICYGGDFRGTTVWCTSEEDFKAECRRWVRDRIRWMRREGLI